MAQPQSFPKPLGKPGVDLASRESGDVAEIPEAEVEEVNDVALADDAGVRVSDWAETTVGRLREQTKGRVGGVLSRAGALNEIMAKANEASGQTAADMGLTRERLAEVRQVAQQWRDGVPDERQRAQFDARFAADSSAPNEYFVALRSITQLIDTHPDLTVEEMVVVTQIVALETTYGAEKAKAELEKVRDQHQRELEQVAQPGRLAEVELASNQQLADTALPNIFAARAAARTLERREDIEAIADEVVDHRVEQTGALAKAQIARDVANRPDQIAADDMAAEAAISTQRTTAEQQLFENDQISAAIAEGRIDLGIAVAVNTGDAANKTSEERVVKSRVKARGRQREAEANSARVQARGSLSNSLTVSLEDASEQVAAAVGSHGKTFFKSVRSGNKKAIGGVVGVSAAALLAGGFAILGGDDSTNSLPTPRGPISSQDTTQDRATGGLSL